MEASNLSQGMTLSISAKKISRRVCFFFEVCSRSEKLSSWLIASPRCGGMIDFTRKVGLVQTCPNDLLDVGSAEYGFEYCGRLSSP